MSELSFGDRVIDLVQDADPEQEVGEMLVLEVHPDTRADEYEIGALEGMTVEEAAVEWPLREQPDYDSGADHVVECVFLESLDRKVAAAWVGKDADELRSLCERNGVGIYSYHSARLERVADRGLGRAFAGP